ncbi:MAG: hypothetical protein ABII96_03240 [Candidatus Zixiibacteriota bacterium]
MPSGMSNPSIRSDLLVTSSKEDNPSSIRINGKDHIKKIGDLNVLSTTDKKEKIQCFLIFPEGENKLDTEYSILQAIVDQAQLFYKYLNWTLVREAGLLDQGERGTFLASNDGEIIHQVLPRIKGPGLRIRPITQ